MKECSSFPMLQPVRAGIPFLLLFLSFLLTGFFRNGVPDGRILARDRYTGDLRETDPRDRDLREMLTGGKQLPDELRLRYSGLRQEVFLAFYDIEGREIWFRFRNDRWDDRPLEVLNHLVPGQAYGVRGSLEGVRREGKTYPVSEPEGKSGLQEQDSHLVFLYESHRPLRLEQILL